MRLLAGSSGFSYDAWKGPFYPEDLPSARMLEWYAERLPAVEINNTFYRMPKPALLAGWAARTPETFRFTLKAPQRITHKQRLVDAGQSTAYLFEAAAALGPRLGPVLFQLPPFLRKDLPRLVDFLPLIPDGRRAAFEFRHPSWFTDDVFDALRARGAALCIAEQDDGERSAPLVATASWGYLRLRKAGYGDDEMAAWSARIAAQPWDEAFVFFKHEDDGAAPKLAARLMGLAPA